MRFFEEAFSAYQRHRRAARTERLLGAMPLEIRKDIGWPDRNERIKIRHSAEY